MLNIQCSLKIERCTLYIILHSTFLVSCSIFDDIPLTLSLPIFAARKIIFAGMQRFFSARCQLHEFRYDRDPQTHKSLHCR